MKEYLTIEDLGLPLAAHSQLRLSLALGEIEALWRELRGDAAGIFSANYWRQETTRRLVQAGYAFLKSNYSEIADYDALYDSVSGGLKASIGVKKAKISGVPRKFNAGLDTGQKLPDGIVRVQIIFRKNEIEEWCQFNGYTPKIQLKKMQQPVSVKALKINPKLKSEVKRPGPKAKVPKDQVFAQIELMVQQGQINITETNKAGKTLELWVLKQFPKMPLGETWGRDQIRKYLKKKGGN